MLAFLTDKFKKDIEFTYTYNENGLVRICLENLLEYIYFDPINNIFVRYDDETIIEKLTSEYEGYVRKHLISNLNL